MRKGTSMDLVLPRYSRVAINSKTNNQERRVNFEDWSKTSKNRLKSQ